MLTSSALKESTLGARKKHSEAVTSLVAQLDKYFDQFAAGSARQLKTGIVLESSVVVGLLNSTSTGEVLHKAFIDERIKSAGKDQVSFFKVVTKRKIKT